MKTKTKAVDETVKRKIPYIRAFEEEDIIETDKGRFSKCFLVMDIESKYEKDYTLEGFNRRFKDFLCGIPDDISFQFVIHNRLVNERSFLDRILKNEDDYPNFSNYVKAYNDVVKDNAEIGHNNVKKDNYFVISIETDLPEDAVKRFRTISDLVEDLFHKIYGIKIIPMTVPDVLKSLYSMLNPGMELENTLTYKSLRKSRLTSKDRIAPASIDNKESHKDYLILNGDTYVRSIFINLLPKKVSDTFISDITSISSNMLLSIQYDHIPVDFSLKHFSDEVSDNMTRKVVNRRESLTDRKLKRTEEFTQMVEHTEDDYFNNAALKVFRKGKASETKVYAVSTVITLFAEDLETLERDTQLLYISANKFATQIKYLDMQQLEGFQSALPLCNCRVDIKLISNIERLAKMHPLNVQEILKKDGLFYGLNAINDNLIIFNRKNFTNPSGLIAGVEHSGKTFQNKREIFNALISTKDRICIISDNDEYDEFVKVLGGRVIEDIKTNIFETIKYYSMSSDKPSAFSKSLMLEAVFKASLIKKRDESREFIKDEQKENDDISSDVRKLMGLCAKGLINFSEYDSAINYIENHADEFNVIGDAVKYLKPLSGDFLGTDSRLELYKAKSPENLICTLDFLWNRSIEDKSYNTSSWVFADPIDTLLETDQGIDYLTEYIEKCNSFKTVVTLVIQNSVKLISDKRSMIRLEELSGVCGYFKLLNQGAIERGKYIEMLHIPDSLVNYIMNVDYGKGLIMTPNSNIAFDDNFYETDVNNEFYRLFK